ncbi:MAG: hypothetical protein Q9182_006334 [Xanthomendoza sp. 2 TL-2023]
MDPLLPQLLSFPPHPPPPVPLVDAAYDKEIKNLRKLLNDLPASALTAGVANGGDLLDILDPSINTLPFLYVLLAHLNAGKQKQTTIGSPLWLKALEFLNRFDSVQVRYVGTEFRRITTFIKDVAIAGKRARSRLQCSLEVNVDKGQPIVAVRPLRTAILRLDPSSSCFTSTHLLFVRLCLEARTFRAAKPVLDKRIYELPSSAKTMPSNLFPCSQHDTSSGFITDKTELSDTISYRDILHYFLYGAMIYLALKEWPRAVHFLEVVLTAPSRHHSTQLQVEAYKKWILANLLAYGEVPDSLPRTTNSQVARHVRSLGRAYEALGRVFKEEISKEHDVRRLNAEVHVGHPKWSGDSNLSLVVQVLDAYRRFTIIKLEDTYAALPISEIGRRTSPNPNDHAETAQYITMMISSGQLNATMEQNGKDPRSWVLRFAASSNTLALSEQERYQELQRETIKTAKLAEYVRETSRKLSLNKDYIHWLKQKTASGASGHAGDDSLMQNQFDDEDLMGDV